MFTADWLSSFSICVNLCLGTKCTISVRPNASLNGMSFILYAVEEVYIEFNIHPLSNNTTLNCIVYFGETFQNFHNST